MLNPYFVFCLKLLTKYSRLNIMKTRKSERQKPPPRERKIELALTKNQLREKLSEAGVPSDKVEGIIEFVMEGHVTSINALRERENELKNQVAALKVDAEKLPAIQSELDALKAKGDPDWQKKYEDEHSAFEDFKSNLEQERLESQKKDLYKAILKECNVEEKRIDAIMRVTDFDKISVKDGKLDGLDDLKKSIESEWGGFILNPEKKGQKVETPPDNGGKGKEPESRAAKIAAEYHDNLYGKVKGD